MKRLCFSAKLAIPSVIAVILLVVGACAGNKPRKIMDRAEEIVESHPDSALRLLESPELKQISLLKQSDRARYGLLMSLALFKNYRDPDNDSLIAPAINYYAMSGNVRALMLSQFCLGIVREHEQRYTEALASYIAAHAEAVELDDKYWIGMTSRSISDIYNRTFNGADELEYALEAERNFRLAGKQNHADYALLDIATAYNNVGEYGKSYEIAKRLVEIADSAHDACLEYEGLQLQGDYFLSKKKFSEALQRYNRVITIPEYAGSVDSLKTAYLYAMLGSDENSENLLAEVSVKNENDSIWYYNTQSALSEKNGNFKNALDNYKKFYRSVDMMVDRRVNVNLAKSAADYYELSTASVKSRLSLARMRLWIVIGLALMLSAAVAAYIMRIMKKHAAELAEKSEFAEQLQNSLRENINTLDQRTQHTREIIRNLLASQYKVLDRFESVVTSPNTTPQRIADALNDLIRNLSVDGKEIETLEERANGSYDNIMSDFRADLPGLKKSDYMLFLFTIFGFSNGYIMLFLKEEKITAVYERRRRLKSKIRSLDKDKRIRYMLFFAR